MKNWVTNISLLLITISVIICCNDDSKKITFDTTKWNEQTDPLFPSPYREKMVSDLTLNHKLTGLTYEELIQLLGIPDNKDSTTLSYKIIVDYAHDIDPVYIKSLDFTYSKDSLITSYKINEWKK